MKTILSDLSATQAIVNADLESFSRDYVAHTQKTYGAYSAEVATVFCDVLTRKANRLRAYLAILSYRMHGGDNDAVALQAARVMELVQTYLLIADDVYDNSKFRRGKPSAHLLLEKFHSTHKLKRDSRRFGETLAMSSAFIGAHLTTTEALKINISPDKLLRAVGFLNSYLQVTNEGQTNDIVNEVLPKVSADRIDNVLEWKTASYTFDGPLRFGAILAGADEEAESKLRTFSMMAGRLFQMTDDYLGCFGDVEEAGKSPMDDTREGKATLISNYALTHAQGEDLKFYASMFGNPNMTERNFEKVKRILITSGAQAFALKKARVLSKQAQTYVMRTWSSTYPEEAQMLQELMAYLVDRKH